LDDDALDSGQTEPWNQFAGNGVISQYARQKVRGEEWADNHSLGISSVISTLNDVTENRLPCLYFQFVHADQTFVLELRQELSDGSTSFYRALRSLTIEGADLLDKIRRHGEALHRQYPMGRKVMEAAASKQWITDWINANKGLPHDVVRYVESVFEGDAKPESVYRMIASLHASMDGQKFNALRAHLNRLTALSYLLPQIDADSDRDRTMQKCKELCREFEAIVKSVFENHITPGGHMDPISIITMISSGLKLVDQFRELALRFMGQTPSKPSGRAEQVGTALEVSQSGAVTERVDASDLHMDRWDSVRYEALGKRIRTQWDIYNDLFAGEAGAGLQEGARVRAEMRRLQTELCRDFKEMVQLYERALGTSLPDHYQLYEVCQ
jgi:hypothetical protein